MNPDLILRGAYFVQYDRGRHNSMYADRHGEWFVNLDTESKLLLTVEGESVVTISDPWTADTVFFPSREAAEQAFALYQLKHGA